MSTYVLIPGAGGSAWYRHLVEPLLRARGHQVVRVELPTDDESAGLAGYTDAVGVVAAGRPGRGRPERSRRADAPVTSAG